MLSNILQEYIHYHILNKSVLDISFLITTFTKISETNYETDYMKLDGRNFYIKIRDELILVTSKYEKAIIDFTDIITINETIIGNVNGNIKTTVGTAVLNFLVIYDIFGKKMSYINKEFDYGLVEKLIAEKTHPDIENHITAEELLNHYDRRLFIDNLASYIGVGVTEYSLRPAPGISKFVTKTIKELEVKYKQTPLIDPKAIAELEAAIIDYDVAYLKQDISYGKLVSKKVIKTSRKRMYAVFGIGNDVTEKKTPILIALNDGLGKNPEVLTALFNDLRGGAAGRGNETKDAGVTTKELINAMSSMVVELDDCGNAYHTSVIVDKTMLSKYIVKNNKLIELTIDNMSEYLGKIVSIRDELYCKKDGTVCIYCIGSKYSELRTWMTAAATDLGGLLLKGKLKKFHGTDLEIVTITKDDFK